MMMRQVETATRAAAHPTTLAAALMLVCVAAAILVCAEPYPTSR